MTLLEQHKAYMNRKVRERCEDDEACLCEECGCSGNCTCGHECIDAHECCTLHDSMICSCCSAVWKAEKEPK